MHGGETGNVNMDTGVGIGSRAGLLKFLPGLNRHQPYPARPAHSGVAHHAPVVSIAPPADCGQENAGNVPIAPNLLRLGIMQALCAAWSLQMRKAAASGKKSGDYGMQACCFWQRDRRNSRPLG